MEKDALCQVINAEKEIQKCLEIEKARVQEWLENAKRESETEYAREEKKLRLSLEYSRKEAMKGAESRAAEILRRAVFEIERLERLDTKTLSSIVEKTVARILPG